MMDQTKAQNYFLQNKSIRKPFEQGNEFYKTKFVYLFVQSSWLAKHNNYNTEQNAKAANI